MFRNLVYAAAVLSLAGCEFFITEDEVFLPGERIPVLLHQRTVNPDPTLADAQILLPAPQPNAEWPQSGGYPNHAMHHMVLGDTVEQKWRSNAGSGASDEERFVGAPVVANGMVFALDVESRVSAFSADTGKIVWSSELAPETEEDDGHIPGGLAHYKDRIYVTTGFGDVIALDSATGQEVWREYVRGPMRSAPTVRNGRLYALTIDSRLIALRADTGETLWTHSGVGEVASLLGGGSPAVDNGIVIVPYASGELVALTADSGQMIWSDSLTGVRRTDTVSTLSHIRGNPIIDRGRVFAVSHGGIMASFDLKTGQRIWDREMGGIGNPWVAGDYIFLLTTEDEIICLSRDDGRVFWVRGLPRFEDPEDKEDPIVWSGPVLASDRLIVTGSHGEAWAISPYSGQLLGRIELPDAISVPPVIADGTIYFMADNADIVAYR